MAVCLNNSPIPPIMPHAFSRGSLDYSIAAVRQILLKYMRVPSLLPTFLKPDPSLDLVFNLIIGKFSRVTFFQGVGFQLNWCDQCFLGFFELIQREVDWASQRYGE